MIFLDLVLIFLLIYAYLIKNAFNIVFHIFILEISNSSTHYWLRILLLLIFRLLFRRTIINVVTNNAIKFSFHLSHFLVFFIILFSIIFHSIFFLLVIFILVLVVFRILLLIKWKFIHLVTLFTRNFIIWFIFLILTSFTCWLLQNLICIFSIIFITQISICTTHFHLFWIILLRAEWMFTIISFHINIKIAFANINLNFKF